MVARIRAALAAGVPPTATILRDPTHTEYDAWDLKLASAVYIYDDIMRGSVPVWWDESDRVAFDVKTGLSKSRRALDRKEHADQKSKKDLEGVYYYVVPRTIDGGALPTRDEWLIERATKMGAVQEGPRQSPLVGLDGQPLKS